MASNANLGPRLPYSALSAAACAVLEVLAAVFGGGSRPISFWRIWFAGLALVAAFGLSSAVYALARLRGRPRTGAKIVAWCAAVLCGFYLVSTGWNLVAVMAAR